MGIQAETVQLGHGSGGQMMKRIIDEVFLEAFGSPELLAGNDAGVAELSPSAAIGASPSTREPATHDDTTAQARLAMSTDSFVVTPQFFPGGDIGRLAICGTVNDVATSGARPLYLSCGFILEEGYPLADLRRICQSMAVTAREADVRLSLIHI